MKNTIKELLPGSLLAIIQRLNAKRQFHKLIKYDKDRFNKYSFSSGTNLDSFEQLEARITKEYHSLEKGFSYTNLRYGFGKQVLSNLLELMGLYKEKNYPLDSHVYLTGLSNLRKYIQIHEKNGHNIDELKSKVDKLGNDNNNRGGAHWVTKEEILRRNKEDFKSFSLNRHSVRDYSDEPVDIKVIEQALELAQKTPSACNRQSWRVRIVEDPKLKKVIQNNQNGNRGFGDYIDKFIVITSDVQYYSKPRERNQANIDGGMYAMNLLYSLQYYNVATVPLSASLVLNQESNLRKALEIKDSENFIMFIGIGNYVDEFKIPISDRRKSDYKYFKLNN